MKRILFYLFIQISVIFSLMADDGGATNFEDWTYGNIYVKEPNDKIALEKELMVVLIYISLYQVQLKNRKNCRRNY